MSFIPKNSNKTRKTSYFLDEITIGAISIAIAIDASREIAIAISPISMIAIGAIAIVIDVDRRNSGDRRDRDRGALVWIVPFGLVCESEQ